MKYSIQENTFNKSMKEELRWYITVSIRKLTHEFQLPLHNHLDRKLSHRLFFQLYNRLGKGIVGK